MVSMSSFSTSSVIPLLNSIKEEVTMRNYNQSTRHSIFKLLDLILTNFNSYIQSIPDDFISTFIHITSGEKDPRNLMISFQLSSRILSTSQFKDSGSLEKYATDLFDVTFCYFPITFEPPKNDPYGITSQNLKDALRNSLSTSGIFAADIFPSLMDKMASSALKVKNEALSTIIACIDNYDPASVAPLWKEIWDGLKFEVLHGTEEISQSLTLEALRSLARSLENLSEENSDDHNNETTSTKNQVQIDTGNDGHDHDHDHDDHDHDHDHDHKHENKKSPVSSLDAYISAIIAETKDQMIDTTNKKSLACATLVAGIAHASPSIFKTLSEATLKPSLENSSKSITLTAQKHLLKITQTFIESAKELSSHPSTPSNILLSFKDSFIVFFTRSLMNVAKTEPEVRVLAVKNISLIISVQGYLDEEEIGLFVQYFDDIILSENDTPILTDSILDTLVQITKSHEQIILSISYPFFLSKLPDSDTQDEKENPKRKNDNDENGKSEEDDDTDIAESPHILISKVLRSLANMAVSRTVFEVLYVRLINKLDIILPQSSEKYPLAIFSTMAAVLRTVLDNHSQDSIFYHKKLVPLLISKFVANNHTDPLTVSSLSNIHVITSASLCILYIVKALPQESQSEFASDLFSLFLLQNKSKLVPSSFDFSKFKPLDKDAAPSPLLSLFLYGLAPISSNIRLDETFDLLLLMDNIKSILLKTQSDKYLRLIYLRLICLLCNKWISDTAASEFIESLKSSITTSSKTANQNERFNSLEILFWVTKAYLIKANNTGFKLVSYILTLLESPTVGVSSSKLMELLVCDDALINKENGAIYRLLFKQRFFVSVIDPLVSGFEESKDFQVKVNYLVALSGILRYMPSSIISDHVSKFFKLLLQSLKIKDSRVREASINTIAATLSSGTTAASEIISQHISTLVPELLKASRDTDLKSGGTPQVRIAALKCLDEFIVHIPRTRLLPQVRTIIQELNYPLDDKRRNVRKVAVITRQKYFELSNAEEDE